MALVKGRKCFCLSLSLGFVRIWTQQPVCPFQRTGPAPLEARKVTGVGSGLAVGSAFQHEVGRGSTGKDGARMKRLNRGFAEN